MSAGSAPSRAPRDAEAVVWHDVECAGYTVDLPHWRELAAEISGPVLELGAGTGRVALDLAAHGHRLWTLDSDPALVEELRRRAHRSGLEILASPGDARTFDLGRRFGLVIAPMQVVQLLGGPIGRVQMLTAVRRHLDPGAILAMAIADPLEGVPSEDPLPPLPDVREANGWVHSSRPVAVREEGGEIVIQRVREAVSPGGERSASAATIRLERTEPSDLTRQATELGFRAREPRGVPATDDYVGSTIVVAEAV